MMLFAIIAIYILATIYIYILGHNFLLIILRFLEILTLLSEIIYIIYIKYFKSEIQKIVFPKFIIVISILYPLYVIIFSTYIVDRFSMREVIVIPPIALMAATYIILHHRLKTSITPHLIDIQEQEQSISSPTS